MVHIRKMNVNKAPVCIDDLDSNINHVYHGNHSHIWLYFHFLFFLWVVLIMDSIVQTRKNTNSTPVGVSTVLYPI